MLNLFPLSKPSQKLIAFYSTAVRDLVEIESYLCVLFQVCYGPKCCPHTPVPLGQETTGGAIKVAESFSERGVERT
ncbi:hypothetical protein GN956_G25877 [Arapaima gigas]